MNLMVAETKMSTGMADPATAPVCLTAEILSLLWVRFCEVRVFGFYLHRYGTGAPRLGPLGRCCLQ